MRRVAIVGIGRTVFKSITPDLAYRELTFEAATKAYQEVGIDPREDVDCFVSCNEDWLEGVAIANEYTPDQVGGALKPVQTLTQDGLYGIISAYMLIRSGIADVVVAFAFSKPSNLLNPEYVLIFAMDPVLQRPLRQNPYFVAGMEMNRFLCETGNTLEQCAMVSVKNKRNALNNPFAAHGSLITKEQVMNSEVLFHPLRRLDVSPPADGAVVIVLASEEKAKTFKTKPIWIKGVGYCSDSPSLETREWGRAIYAELAGEMAYKMAGITRPSKEIDVAEIDDTFSYKELQHMEALKLCRRGEAGLLVEEGATQIGGELPINPSGGSLGVGLLWMATGLERAAELVLQLRGEAGKNQVPNAKVGLAMSWRGIPTASGAVVILSSEG